MKNKYNSSTISIISSIFMLLTIMGSVICLVLAFLKVIHIVIAIISIILSICYITLMYALANALERIEKLETALLDKKVIEETDLEKEEEKTFEEIENGELEGVTLCKECGYQLFEDDLECPNCHTKKN